MKSVTAPLACSQCGASLRPDAAWCPLCFTQVAGAFDPLTAPIEDVLSQGGGTATLTQPLQPVAEPTVQNSPPAPEPVAYELSVEETMDDAAVEQGGEISDVDVMLAMLAAEHRQADPSTQIVDRMGDKNARIVIMIGGSVAIALVGFVMLALLGSLS